MLAINKNSNNPLSQFCNKIGACYDNIPTEIKKKLVESLLHEQGHLCAYCMTKINKNNTHIEHWYPQELEGQSKPTTHAEKEKQRLMGINYKNLLAVCSGGKGQLTKLQHCDTHKKNKLLKFNPAEPSHALQLRIGYSKSTGQIFSDDVSFNNELNQVLNLNLTSLSLNRKQVILYMDRALKKLKRTANTADLNKMLTYWKQKNQAQKLPEYTGVVIYFLEKRLDAM